jgi:hypothetical protein
MNFISIGESGEINGGNSPNRPFVPFTINEIGERIRRTINYWLRPGKSVRLCDAYLFPASDVALFLATQVD